MSFTRHLNGRNRDRRREKERELDGVSAQFYNTVCPKYTMPVHQFSDRYGERSSSYQLQIGNRFDFHTFCWPFNTLYYNDGHAIVYLRYACYLSLMNKKVKKDFIPMSLSVSVGSTALVITSDTIKSSTTNRREKRGVKLQKNRCQSNRCEKEEKE